MPEKTAATRLREMTEMTRAQVARGLGLTERTVDSYRSLPPDDPKHLPSERRRGRVTIKVADVDRWLVRNKMIPVLLTILVLLIAGSFVACAIGSADACEILRFLGLPRVRNNL